MLPIIFSGALLTGGAVCLICDLAVSGGLTWSLIPLSSIAYAWAVVFPGLMPGERRLFRSLLALSVATVPYLYALSRLLKAGAVFSVGWVMAVISITFLWLLLALFKRRGRTPAAAGGAFLLSALLAAAINGALAVLTAAPVFDGWDALSISLLLALAFASFAWGCVRERE